MFLGRAVGASTAEWPDADPRGWLPEDTEAALEWADFEASLCAGCGNPRDECMSPDADGTYEAVPFHCFACATRDAEDRRIGEDRSSGQFGSGAFDGLFVAITEKGA